MEHQSGADGWTPDQLTTLPNEIFDELSKFNFFYKAITPRIAEILNHYFDAVIVTIDPYWLLEILRVFKGKVIYRTYGHVSLNSLHLLAHGGLRALRERDNFFYVPHANEAARHEHFWLKERMVVVPYCVTDEVVANLDNWTGERSEVMVSCPNISNRYFKNHYKYLKRHFYNSNYKFYGVQMSRVTDPQIVGTLPFTQVLKAYNESAAFLYTYRETTVCFLPPIEMMIAGGPVVYLSGSLLAQYFGERTPGLANDEDEAKKKVRCLLAKDRGLLSEILDSQIDVRNRYLPDHVWPIFDREFVSILRPTTQNNGKRQVIDCDEFRHEFCEEKDNVIIVESVEGLHQSEIEELISRSCVYQRYYIFCHARDLLIILELVAKYSNVFVVLGKSKIVSKEIEPYCMPIGVNLPVWCRALLNPKWTAAKIREKILANDKLKILILGKSLKMAGVKQGRVPRNMIVWR